MIMIVQNYLWCAEKAYLSSVALAVGVVTNIGLNLVLLPPLGLLGAVLATTTANLVALGLICLFIGRLGFPFDPGVRVVIGLPPVVCLGPWIAMLVLLVVAAEAVFGRHLLSDRERREIADGTQKYLGRLPWLRRVWTAKCG
jgi:O-antigen/teichoic acid export membrane protein